MSHSSDAPAAELGAFGAAKVYQVAGDFGDYDTGAVTSAIVAAIEASGADVVLTAASFLGKDAIPRVVARTNGGQSSAQRRPPLVCSYTRVLVAISIANSVPS